MKTTTAFKATIGLDWADQKHDLWIRPADSQKLEHRILPQTPEALHSWVAQMRQQFQNGLIAIAVETSRGPIISALMAYDFIGVEPGAVGREPIIWSAPAERSGDGALPRRSKPHPR